MRIQSFSIDHTQLATFLLTLVLSMPAWAAHYSAISESCVNLETQTLVTAIREVESGSKTLKLTVNPTTLETKLIPAKKLKCEKSPATASGPLASSIYGRALVHLSTPSTGQFLSGNEGLKRFSPACAVRHMGLAPALQPMSLTLDLCPAQSKGDAKHPHRPFDRNYLESLRREGQQTGRVVNATLFISGGWLRMHRAEAKELLELNDASRGLSLTFANHSNTHPYLGTHIAPLKNFMTAMSRSEFIEEVLTTEKEMLKAGMTPSIFFRFPGLMSNAAEIEALQELGLIPVGTSAWLALDGGYSPQYAGFDFSTDQSAKAGRVLLTHGNGNEENGVRGQRGFLNFLSAHGSRSSFIPLTTATACSLE